MPDKEHTLYLLDAYALIYRAHFAFIRNPRMNSKKMNTSASYGFTNSLVEILHKEQPTHIGVAFDMEGPTMRHEAYEDYKANRQEQPEEIRQNLPFIKEIVKGFNIPILELEGYEADDVIGTLAKKAGKEGYVTYMVTPDKDFGQLIDGHTYMYKPSYKNKPSRILGVKEIKEEWGIEEPEQVIDILALMGDTSDNIPGVPGIGPKTAGKLITQYGSVQGIYDHLDELKGKQKQSLEENKEQAFESRSLATIITDAPLDFDPEGLRRDEPDQEALIKVFAELEFRTLTKRLFNINLETAQTGQTDLFNQHPAEVAEEINLDDLATLEDTEHTYHTIDTEEKLDDFLRSIRSTKEFAFDTETDSLNALRADLIGLSFSWKAHEAYYIPYQGSLGQKALEELKPVFANPAITKIAQNMKFDMLVLGNYDIEIKGPYYDTMLAHYIIDPSQKHNMEAIATTHLGYRPVSIETLIGKKGKGQKSMKEADQEKLAEYAAEDADLTYRMKGALDKKLKDKKQRDLLMEIEGELIPVLESMERWGVYVNKDTLKELSEEYAQEIEKIEQRIFEQSGTSFNINSTQQLGEVLFDRLKLEDKPKKTKTGRYSTSEEVLSKLANENEIAQLVLDYREFSKLKNTYIDALPKLIHEADGRIHTSFNQAVAATGRLSSNNPNLQNIPIRTDYGRRIRKAFQASGEGWTLLAADYSQIELRIMAAFSEDSSMMDAFRKGKDIHAATAAKVFKVKESEVTSEMRSKAKTVNFGIIYGISPFGLSQRMHISRSEAAEIIDSYFENFSAVKDYMDASIEKAKKQGYAETYLGRRRYLPELNSRNATQRGFAERNAINSPIQGTAADIIKKAMIDVHHWMKAEKLKSRMILQVHDELVFDVYEEELDTVKKQVEELMVKAIELQVPMEVEIGIGQNWLEAH